MEPKLQSVFIPVNVEDELPPKDEQEGADLSIDVYFTLKGGIKGFGFYNYIIKDWTNYDDGKICQPTHWLKSVTCYVLTENEFQDYTESINNEAFNAGFESGCSTAANDILG